MPNFMYPRTISIVRAGIQKTVDNGLHQGETSIAQGIDANIEIASTRSAPPIITPGPTNTNDSTPHWMVYLPPGTVTTAQKGDKITDDLGRVFQIEAAMPHGLGETYAARNYAP